MTLKKPSIYALAFALATTPALQSQNAYGQTTSPLITASENYCRANPPKNDVTSFSTLSVSLKSCMRAFAATKQADIAWNAAWGQVLMAQHYHYFSKPFPNDYNFIAQATNLMRALASSGYNVTELNQAITQIRADHQQYRALSYPSGTDTSAEAYCIYNAPSDTGPSFATWFARCDQAYNQNKNPLLAQYYAVAAAAKASILYDQNNISEAKRFFETSKNFEAYADSMGWSTSGLKEMIGKLQQVLDPSAANTAIAQQQEQKPGLSAGQKAAVLVGAAILFGLLAKGMSGSSNSPSPSGYDPGEFDRQRERDLRNRPQQPSPSQPRSYGFYGDCPSPGMGYGC